MHNNTNYQCKICWNKALTFGVGSIQLSFRIYHCVHPIHANMFSIQMLLSNCAEGLLFSAFILFVFILFLCILSCIIIISCFSPVFFILSAMYRYKSLFTYFSCVLTWFIFLYTFICVWNRIPVQIAEGYLPGLH